MIGYRIGAGFEERAAKVRQFFSAAECIEAVKQEKFQGEIWMAPITVHGVGRWFKVGRYDGRGRALLGLEDEDATEESLVALLKFLVL